MKTLKELKDIKGKRVLVRVDFNVPLSLDSKKVMDDFRIKKSLPTIEYLMKKGAKVILIAHHDGKDDTQTLEPAYKVLKKYIPKAEFMTNSPMSNTTEMFLSKIANGSVTLLENIRREIGEKRNDVTFARGLSRLGDIYVNEAFSDSHRAHASIVGLPKFLPSYIGFQFEEEVDNLSLAFNPAHPFLFILGGAKFETKMPLIQKFVKTADTVYVAGALMNDFFKDAGYSVGKSTVDDVGVNLKSLRKFTNLILPVDVEVAVGKNHSFKKPNEVSGEDVIVDIGPQSVIALTGMVEKAKFVLWNGPLGKYEIGFGGATEKILKAVSNSKAKSIIGGGDTVEIVSKLKLEKKFTFVSTGGGATLDFLAKGTLPGIQALNKEK